MPSLRKKFAGSLVAITLACPALAEVNVAFFLEWATPNQVAKVEREYDAALGVAVNWVSFDVGTQMTEAMLAGDIDISYSQGMAPFVTGVNTNAPIKMVAIAVRYPADDCVVRHGEGIDQSNASELEGKDVAVPLATMTHYSFLMMMRALEVNVAKLRVIDQAPADAAVALADGNVTMACGFGANSMRKMYAVGAPLMSASEKEAAGIISFDLVSVTEKFAQENPDLLRTFLEVTNDANAAFAADPAKIGLIARDAGLSVAATRRQMANFTFPSHEEQLQRYFNEGGLVSRVITAVGEAFATPERPSLADYSVVIDPSFLN